MFRTRKVCTVALVALLAACSGEDPLDLEDGLGSGTFEGSVSGSVSTSFSGQAWFVSGTGAGDEFVLALIGGSAGTLFVHRPSSGRPSTGTHQLGDPALPATSTYVLGSVGSTSFESSSGTLTITSSSVDAVVGSLEFEGPASTTSGDAGTVSASVSFNAPCNTSGGSISCN
jgi:hypothetical protein